MRFLILIEIIETIQTNIEWIEYHANEYDLQGSFISIDFPRTNIIEFFQDFFEKPIIIFVV